MKLLFCLAALLVLTLGSAELPNREALFALPNWSTAPGYEPAGTDGIRGIFYDGLPYHGKPTRVFAWYGKPAGAEEPLPAVILIHGGGGTAFRYWAALWVKRGYAVLAWTPTAAYRPTTEIPAATEASAIPTEDPALAVSSATSTSRRRSNGRITQLGR